MEDGELHFVYPRKELRLYLLADRVSEPAQHREAFTAELWAGPRCFNRHVKAASGSELKVINHPWDVHHSFEPLPNERIAFRRGYDFLDVLCEGHFTRESWESSAQKSIHEVLHLLRKCEQRALICWILEGCLRMCADWLVQHIRWDFLNHWIRFLEVLARCWPREQGFATEAKFRSDLAELRSRVIRQRRLRFHRWPGSIREEVKYPVNPPHYPLEADKQWNFEPSRCPIQHLASARVSSGNWEEVHSLSSAVVYLNETIKIFWEAWA